MSAENIGNIVDKEKFFKSLTKKLNQSELGGMSTSTKARLAVMAIDSIDDATDTVYYNLLDLYRCFEPKTSFSDFIAEMARFYRDYHCGRCGECLASTNTRHKC